MSVQNVFVTLLPDPDDYTSPKDEKWQEVCEELYLDIRKKIPQGQAKLMPTQKKGSENTRSSDIFYGGFKILYDLLKLWVENRNQNKERVSVNIKIGNNEVNISNISKEEAIALCERYTTEGQTELTP